MAESKGFQSEFIPKMATGFCSGVSRTGGICGAVSGAIMGLSLLYGRNLPDESVDKCYTAVQKLTDAFTLKFGSTNCRKLTGCDLGTKEGQDTFKSNNTIEQCKNYTEEAAKMVMSIIEDVS